MSVPISLHRQTMWNLNMEDSRIFSPWYNIKFWQKTTPVFCSHLYLYAITSTFRLALMAEDDLITSPFVFQVSRVDSSSHFSWVIFPDNPEKLIKVKHGCWKLQRYKLLEVISARNKGAFHQLTMFFCQLTIP